MRVVGKFDSRYCCEQCGWTDAGEKGMTYMVFLALHMSCYRPRMSWICADEWLVTRHKSGIYNCLQERGSRQGSPKIHHHAKDVNKHRYLQAQVPCQ
jgi:hypothetical protein